MNGIWKFEFASSLDLLQEFDSIFTLAYLELDCQWIWFLVNTLMKVISKALTWGVIALPLKRNLVLRFRWRGHRKWWTMYWVSGTKDIGYQDSWKENFSVIHATFPFMNGWHSTLSNRIVLHESTCFGLHYSIFLVQRLCRVPMLRTFSNSKLDWSLALLKMIFSLGDRTGWIHKVTVEIALTWCRNEQHYLRYWIDLDDSWVSLGHNVGYQKAPVKPQW
jgi:hypothetical protein